jgi:hypothetical protein
MTLLEKDIKIQATGSCVVNTALGLKYSLKFVFEPPLTLPDIEIKNKSLG